MNNLFIRYEKVDRYNLSDAIKIQNIIFPNENGSENFKEAVNFSLKRIIDKYFFKEVLEYWLCRDESNNIIGITGIYSFRQYPEDGWCGWFGILPEYRGHKYGEQVFLWTMQRVRELGFKNFRLYTDLEDNKSAVGLYRKMGMVEESYDREKLKLKYAIFSKSFVSDKVDKWNNKMLFLNEQEKLYN